MASLPPTKAALRQHFNRAVYQGVLDWGTAAIPLRQLPSPTDWGWKDPENWKAIWTNLPKSKDACKVLQRCKCRYKCTSCICVSMDVNCTELCT